ncbi:MAG: catalase HPII, partial [Tardiphaga sp.]|nr:catalase HPII [Tardiphaga sp.]
TPSLLDPSGPRESPTEGFRSFATPLAGNKQRHRSPSFADHYSQARQFFLSQTEPEQDHIVAALIFELSKVEADIVRTTILGHLVVIDDDLGNRVAAGLGHAEAIIPATPAVEPRSDLGPAPSLSMLARGTPPLTGRQFGALVSEGAGAAVVAALKKSVKAAGATLKIVCPTIGGVVLDDGSLLKADHQLAGAPSVLFDAVAVIASEAGASALLAQSAAVAWVHDAFAHLKVIGTTSDARLLLDVAGVEADEGITDLDAGTELFVETAAGGRIWDREPDVRTVY